MDILSILGIMLAIIGIAFAFETPRHWLLSKFKKSSPVAHEFKIHTSFHSHNEGKPLGALGTNKIENILKDTTPDTDSKTDESNEKS